MKNLLWVLALLSAPCLMAFLLLSDALYAAEKLLLLVGGLAGICWLAFQVARNYPVLRRTYLVAVLVIECLLALVGALASQKLWDRRLLHGKVYLLLETKTSIQEEMEATLYELQPAGRKEVITEFYQDGIGSCRLRIADGPYGIEIEKACD